MKKSITIRIENFRSLKDVTLELNDVNLFIGPNNSGKTNVFKALQFLGDWLRPGEPKDFQNNYFGKKIPLISENEYIPMAFSIIFEIEDNIQNIYRVEFFKSNIVYQLVGIGCSEKKIDLKEQDLKIATISYEKLFDSFQIRLQNNEHSFLIDEQNKKNLNEIKLGSSNYLVYKNEHYSLDETTKDYIYKNEGLRGLLMNNPIIEQMLDDIKNRLDGFYTIKVDKIKENTKYKLSPKVDYDASNLAHFIENMSHNSPSTIKIIKKDFLECVGNEFTDITCPTVGEEGNQRKLKFFDSEGNSYWADEVSEGVLYFLAIVCILHQPEPPKFLLLEEPENGIHPRRISKIMDYIFDLAEEKDITVIMTSHSPVVLDEFKDVPENVFIFDKNEETKATEVVKLSDFIRNYNEKAKEKGLSAFSNDISLGDYWLTGLINGVPSL